MLCRMTAFAEPDNSVTARELSLNEARKRNSGPWANQPKPCRANEALCAGDADVMLREHSRRVGQPSYLRRLAEDSMRFQTSFLGTLTLATLATLSLSPRTAHATGVSEVSTTGKGAVGGALIGAEVVLAAEAAFDTKPTWAYVVGGVGGGIAGGIGGYFIERNANP
ncbi:MAG TPA: hypothetical protein VGI70_15795, partial [Polyangiales bacterium]